LTRWPKRSLRCLLVEVPWQIIENLNLKFMVCPHGQEGRGGSNFRDFVWTPLWTASNNNSSYGKECICFDQQNTSCTGDVAIKLWLSNQVIGKFLFSTAKHNRIWIANHMRQIKKHFFRNLYRLLIIMYRVENLHIVESLGSSLSVQKDVRTLLPFP